MVGTVGDLGEGEGGEMKILVVRIVTPRIAGDVISSAMMQVHRSGEVESER